jgi:hypothetical protein
MAAAMRTVLAILFALQGPQANVYRNDAEGVRILLPTGWQQIPEATLRLYEKSAQRSGAPPIHYDAAFGRRSAPRWFEYPYVMVQMYDAGAVSPAAMASQLNSNSSAPPQTSSRLMAGRAVYGFAAYVPAKDAVLWDMNVPRAIGGRLFAYAAFRATSRGHISIFAYGMAPDSLRVAALRDSMLAGLSIDEAHAYRPTAAAAVAAGNTSLETALGAAAVLGLFVAVLLVLRTVRAKEEGATP